MMLMLQNKYRKLYFTLIERFGKETKFDDSERHHILPRCCNGTNSLENLKYIPIRVHFICHLLLPKFIVGKEKYLLDHAAWMMMKGHQRTKLKITSKIYEMVRREYRKARTILMTGHVVTEDTRKKMSAAGKGKTVSEETRKKISIANTGRLVGLKRDAEFSKKISIALKGHKKTPEWINKINRNPDKIAKTAAKHRGMKRSDETKRNISASKLGKPPGNLGKKYYYNPNTHEKIMCSPGQEPMGYINGLEKSRNKSHGILGGKYYYNIEKDIEIVIRRDQEPPNNYVPGRRKKWKKTQ